MVDGARDLILGIIPARGGSKGVPRKNIAPLAGKPLLAWTVEAARASGVLDRIVVSTEDPEIAEVARRAGAEVPFLRPAELARDDSPGIDPVLHALDALDRQGYRPAWVLVLQPTSPLRKAEDIRGVEATARQTGADVVISVCEAVPPPAWMKQIASDGTLQDFFPQDLPATRQMLPRAFALNGALYLARVSVLRQQKSFYGGPVYPYLMPRERSLDIDSLWDLELAEMILRRKEKS
jgi:CMP-N-acetylneuraminic acid synthetase